MDKEEEFGVIRSVIQTKDLELYSKLFIKYEQRIIKSIIKYVKDINIAKDIAQDSFIKSFENIETFRFESSYYTWLYAIATNTAKDFLRRRKRRNSHQLDIDYEPRWKRNKKSADLDPYKKLVNKESLEFVKKTLSTLSGKHRKTLCLHVFEGKSYNEIAKKLDIPYGTVISRIYNARKHLKSKIKLVKYRQSK